jgi:catechol 2,3-dioxygenase-like lactoylglutathione lyase family enzyme
MSIEINHVLVRTHDLENMTAFLIQVLGLKKGFRPPFNFIGDWLYSDDKPLIHLVEVAADDESLSDYLGGKTSSSDIGMGAVDHIAFTGVDYSGLLNRLQQQHIKYYERTIPLTNEHQVFVDGPDGLKLEILFNLDKS